MPRFEDSHSFRCTTEYAEVLEGVADYTPELRWVIKAANDGRYPRAYSKHYRGALLVYLDEDNKALKWKLLRSSRYKNLVVLVPIRDWDSFCSQSRN